MQMRKAALIFICAAGVCLLGRSRETALPASGPAEVADQRQYIALTFDDGPRRSTTARLLDGLLERGASATFFVVGEELSGCEDLVERMLAEGHQIGNHTWSHVCLKDISPEAAAEEIGRTDTALRTLTGDRPYWLRPPYGLVPPDFAAQTPMVAWSVDPRDWESRDTEKVVRAVLEKAGPNAIILLHDIYAPSVDAALEIVDALQAKGYTFVTVEELLRLNGVIPRDGVMYRSGDA